MTGARPVPAGLMAAFHAYETALMTNDVAELDRLFADTPTTLRGDSSGLLVGHDQIRAFRGTRGGAPARKIAQTHVQTIDDSHALVVAVTRLASGGLGQQTQLWVRHPDQGWQVTAAHVSVPAPALDTRIWRVVGDPLVAGAEHGSLAGHTVAVKDLFAVAGQPIGAGNPAWLAQADIETVDATAVAALRSAGAAIRGIARTDEFAYSLAGVNEHYGTAPNPPAPGRLPGGSSSGSATAVSLGQATVGLGTDTGGSIRVPSAYQGLFGIRTTHGAVSRDGLLPLSPRFDTVGWMTRSADDLAAVGDVLIPPGPIATGSVVVAIPELLDLADADVAAAVAGSLPETKKTEHWDLGALDSWLAAMQTVQAYEAWQSYGSWLGSRLETLGDDVRGRFERAAAVSEEAVASAHGVLATAREQILGRVNDRIIVLPSTSSIAPRPADAQTARDATMRLTCLAGIGGLPAVSIPVRTASGAPAGLCLLAAPGRDRDLLELARTWASA